MTTNSRGVAPVVVIVALAVGAIALLLPSWHLPAFLQKTPPTAQLQKSETDLLAARAAQAAAEAQLAQARAAEVARTTEQIRYAQSNAAGATTALAHVPPAHLTPEVKLAADLIGRTNTGLAAAIGALPPDQREEMERLVTGALSAKQAEVDAARAALAEKDAQLQTTISEKSVLAAEIPQLQAAVQTKTAEVQVKAAEVQTRTQEVSAWAEKKAAADAKAGSLDAYAGNLVRIIIAIGILYVIAHFMLPSLAQEFPASRVLTWIDKTVKSVTSARL